MAIRDANKYFIQMNIFKPNGEREIDFQLTNSAVKELRSNWISFTENEIGEYPNNKFEDRGIVICAGGIKYFTCAWIAIETLRLKGCTLPIEIWYKEQEMPPLCIEEIEKYNAVCKKISDYTDERINGWLLKPLSILYSRFKEIIYIDADNVCIENPEILFESEEFINTGALFWPDHWETSKDNPIWAIMKVDFYKAKEQESGQLVIDKEKSWRALNLCCHLNRKRNVYHKLLLGDKDTFRFAWLATNSPYKIIEGEPGTCGYFDRRNNFMGHTMVQFFNSKPFFLHRNLLKWDITRDGEFVWKKIKVFEDNARQKNYFIDYSHENNHTYVDIQGDIHIIDFQEEIGSIENVCQYCLMNLRSQPFYKEFLILYYLNSNRFINTQL